MNTVFIVDEISGRTLRRFHTVAQAENWIANLKTRAAQNRAYRGEYGIDAPKIGLSYIPKMKGIGT